MEIHLLLLCVGEFCNFPKLKKKSLKGLIQKSKEGTNTQGRT